MSGSSKQGLAEAQGSSALSSLSVTDLPPPPLPPPGETPGPWPELEPSGAERRAGPRPPRGKAEPPRARHEGWRCHRRAPTLSPPLQMRSWPTANPPACPADRCPAAAPPRAASRPAAPAAPAGTARAAAGHRGTAAKGAATAAARGSPIPVRRRRSDKRVGRVGDRVGDTGMGTQGTRRDVL